MSDPSIPLSASVQTDRFRNALALIVILAFVSTLPFLMFKDIPPTNKEIIIYVLGQISGMALTVVGFYFVSKAGEEAANIKRAETTTKAFEAITATANATPTGSSVAAADAANKVADAAVTKADEIAGDSKPGSHAQEEPAWLR